MRTFGLTLLEILAPLFFPPRTRSKQGEETIHDFHAAAGPYK